MTEHADTGHVFRKEPGRLLLLLAALALSCRSVATMTDTGFLDRTLTDGGRVHRYVVYVPKEWTPEKRWPVILFLHGSGERGDDGQRQTAVGLGPAIRWNPERFPAIVVLPQARAGTRWMGDEARFAMRALERTVTELAGDPDRLYLTGMSLGGYGVWHLALENPGRFAAIVPVCGGIVKPQTAQNVRQSPITIDAADPYAFTAERLRGLPAWIFHGADDSVIPASESRRMHEELRLRNAPVRYTEYPGVGHNAWDPAYGDPALWEWLFAQHRR